MDQDEISFRNEILEIILDNNGPLSPGRIGKCKTFISVDILPKFVQSSNGKK